MVITKVTVFGDRILVSPLQAQALAIAGVAPILIETVPVTPTSNWAGCLIQLDWLMLSQTNQPSGKILMAMATVMSKLASKEIVVENHRVPVTVTASAALIPMVMVGPTKVIDSHRMHHNGEMLTVMALETTLMGIRLTNVRMNL